ncbi:MAG TPA: DUF4178 domain-containing protein [Solirubrobacteraceae bacterium]
MTVVIIVVLLLLIGVGVYSLMRGRERKPVTAGGASGGTPSLPGAEPASAVRSSVRGLRVGDVVNYEGHDSIVERTYRFREGGSRWEEHLLVDGDYKRWLSVEDDEGLECVVWERRPDPGLEPGAKTIEVDGTTYEFDEQGTADYTLEESGGPGGAGSAEYSDYEAGDKRLSFERYDGSGWELNVGVVVSEHAFDVYPGSQS